MTLIEAINRIDSVKLNTFSQDDKIRLLSELDGKIKAEIIDTHEGAEAVTFSGYSGETSLSAPLLVPAPYDDIYVLYLEAMIDRSLGEYARFDNSSAMFNEAYSAFTRWYNRTHMPLCKSNKFSL